MPGAPPTAGCHPRRRRPRPPSSRDTNDDRSGFSQRQNKVDVLTEALSFSAKTQIDMLLERRQLEEPSIAVLANGGGVAPAGQGLDLMTADELAEAYEDVYGRPPPDVARSEERLLALEREVGRLPLDERGALTEAMTKHPLLFVNCPHTKMILEQDTGDSGGGKAKDEEDSGDVVWDDDFDAEAAAWRLARYWERRLSLFGEKGCYAPGTFQRDTFSAYKRLYSRTVAAAAHPDADDQAKEKAETFLRIVHDVKVQALNAMLELERDNAKKAHLREYALLALQSSDDLKLQFLHAEDFNETKAARRIVSYWKIGRCLFGPSFRTSKNSVSLDKINDCSVLLKLHQWRLMPREDKCGRSVLILRQLLSSNEDEKRNDCLSLRKIISLGINENHLAKVLWYFLQSLLERKSCQRNGYVMVFDTRITHVHFNKFKPFRQALANVVNCFPLKCRAIHFILGPDRPWWQHVVAAISNRGLPLRRRFVVHMGETDVTVAKLSGDFGIGRDNLPVDLGGKVEEEYFTRWLEERRAAGL